MQIDWFTLIAQMVNFLILLLLLRRFLYRPIIRVMDQRQALIVSSLEEAAQEREEAEREAEAYRRQRQELEAAREDLLLQTRQDVESQRREMLHEAQAEVDELQNRWYEAVGRERTAFLRQLREHVGRQSTTIARQALSDLADADLEASVVETFIARMREMSVEEKRAIANSFRSLDRPVTISSVFELPAEARQRLVRAITEEIMGGESVETEFSLAPELLAGIELRAADRRVAWSIQDYLHGLEESLTMELLDTTADELARGPERHVRRA